MEQRRNKFAYDRDYYRNLSERIVNSHESGYAYGSAARKLELMSDPYADEYDEAVEEAYRELYAQPLYDEPAYEPARKPSKKSKPSKAQKVRKNAYAEPVERQRREVVRVNEPKVKVKRVVKVDIMHVLMLTIAVAAMVYFCYNYLTAKANLNETNKMIAKKQVELSSLRDKNNAELSNLDNTYDSEYILSYAVKKLGMVYPKDNTVCEYQLSDSGYVRQYEEIEEDSGVSLLNVILPQQ